MLFKLQNILTRIWKGDWRESGISQFFHQLAMGDVYHWKVGHKGKTQTLSGWRHFKVREVRYRNSHGSLKVLYSDSDSDNDKESCISTGVAIRIQQ